MRSIFRLIVSTLNIVITEDCHEQNWTQ
jgi:hypothetical protein